MKFGITGHAIVFGGTDLDGEYFDAQTDYGLATENKHIAVYDHGMDDTVAKQRIGMGTLTRTDYGLRFDGLIDVPARFATRLQRLIRDGELGFSTGALGHLVEKQLMADGRKRILSWHAGEISLTSSPAEPRAAVALKMTPEEIDAKMAELKARNDERLKQIMLQERKRVALLNHLRVKNLIRMHELGLDKHDNIKNGR